MLSKFFFILTIISFKGAFAEICPTADFEGVYTSSECQIRTVRLAGKVLSQKSVCRPVIRITSTDDWQECAGWSARILGKTIWSNITCSNEITFEDPESLLEGISHGSEVVFRADCSTIKSLK